MALDGIVALRGYDGYGDAAALPAPPLPPAPPSPPMTPATKLIWVLSLSAIGYIFWATLQPKSRRLVTRAT